jgi:hypothetical protein
MNILQNALEKEMRIKKLHKNLLRNGRSDEAPIGEDGIDGPKEKVREIIK